MAQMLVLAQLSRSGAEPKLYGLDGSKTSEVVLKM
jgi:hypothetical protein